MAAGTQKVTSTSKNPSPPTPKSCSKVPALPQHVVDSQCPQGGLWLWPGSQRKAECAGCCPPLDSPESTVLLPASTRAPHEEASPGSVEATQHCLLESRLHQGWCASPFPATQPRAPADPVISLTELPSRLRPCQKKITLLASPYEGTTVTPATGPLSKIPG